MTLHADVANIVETAFRHHRLQTSPLGRTIVE
jgi:hypothetical protein